MSVTNVKSRWVEGNLVFYDYADAVICTFDGTNRAVTFPSGSALTAPTSVAQAGYGVSVRDINGTTGIPIVPAEVAGNFNILLSANVMTIQGEICDNETEVSEGSFQFRLPADYVDGGTITARLPAALIKTAAAVNNGSTLDLECFASDGAGAVGADICATAAATFAADDTWYNKDFTITPTGLVSGDLLNFVITASVVDSEAGGGTLRMNLEAPEILLDVKG